MNLTVFCAETLPTGTQKMRAPTITFGKKGLITFSSGAVEMTELKAGDKISIGQDPDNPQDWYFFKDKGGFELRGVHETAKMLAVNHSALCRSVLGAFDLDWNEPHTFKIAGTPSLDGKTKYWGILITAPILEH